MLLCGDVRIKTGPLEGIKRPVKEIGDKGIVLDIEIFSQRRSAIFQPEILEKVQEPQL